MSAAMVVLILAALFAFYIACGWVVMGAAWLLAWLIGPSEPNEYQPLYLVTREDRSAQDSDAVRT